MAENQTPAAPADKQPAPSPIHLSPASLKTGAVVEPVVPAPVVPKAPEADPLAPRFAELDKAHAKLSAERRKMAEERKAHKAELDEATNYKKLHQERLRNPDKYLKSVYGEDYYDKLTRLKTDGVPPADLVASEVDERVAALQAKLDEQAASIEKRFADQQEAEAKAAKDSYLNGAVEHAKSNPDKYKLLARFVKEGLGNFNAVAQKIEEHFRATCKQDADGNWQPGETLSHDKAAEEVEKGIAKIGEVFKAYFTEEAKTKAPAPERQEQAPRRDEDPSKPWSHQSAWARAMRAGDESLASRQKH